MCKFCEAARKHGGKQCKPCWRKQNVNKKKKSK